jgi:hypothetical protein
MGTRRGFPAVCPKDGRLSGKNFHIRNNLLFGKLSEVAQGLGIGSAYRFTIGRQVCEAQA